MHSHMSQFFMLLVVLKCLTMFFTVNLALAMSELARKAHHE